MLEHLIDSPTATLLAFFLGVLFGNYFAIFRDRRREFNEIINPIRPRILDEAERPDPMRLAISTHQADAIACRLKRRDAEGFLDACNDYWHTHERHDKDDLGQPRFNNPEPVRQAAAKLLDYVKPR